MPVKNTALYVTQCIDSIIAQDYTDWELLAVDDHSDDGSLDIMNRFADEDRRIRVLVNVGSGIIDALNTGYRASTGSFITRMDSDDHMPAHKFRTMIGQLKDVGNGHLATGLVRYFSENELGKGYIAYQDWLNGLSVQGANFTEIYKECPIPSPCWMLSRDDFDRSGGFSSELYPEDYDLCFRFYRAGLKVLPATEVLHFWRDHGMRSSRTHENYADNNFIQIKVLYFIELHYRSTSQLVLWGAGQRAKEIAKLLINNNIRFGWVCNNSKKVGKDIYGVCLKPILLSEWENDVQIILTMANKEEQIEVNALLSAENQIKTENIFWMC